MVGEEQNECDVYLVPWMSCDRKKIELMNPGRGIDATTNNNDNNSQERRTGGLADGRPRGCLSYFLSLQPSAKPTSNVHVSAVHTNLPVIAFEI